MANSIKNITKKISIIAPFFNECESLPIFYKEIKKIINKINNYEFELIFIDDGSTDKSLLYLLDILKEDQNINIIELSRNFGKEAALTAGIDASTGDAVILIDVDLQDPPFLIFEFIKKWENENDVVLARRFDRTKDSLFKRFFASFFYKIYGFLINNKNLSNIGDFRLLDRKVVDSIKLLKEKNRYMKGLLSWPGFKVDEVLYAREQRVAGKTKINVLQLFDLAFQAITSFSVFPLKFFTLAGVFGLLVSFFLFTIITIQKFFYTDLTQGYAFLISLILFFGSFQLIGIGILGEYIGKIYLETKNRPIYIVKKYHRKN